MGGLLRQGQGLVEGLVLGVTVLDQELIDLLGDLVSAVEPFDVNVEGVPFAHFEILQIQKIKKFSVKKVMAVQM